MCPDNSDKPVSFAQTPETSPVQASTDSKAEPEGQLSMDKMQANFMAGLSSNFTTMGGALGSWVLMVRNEWVEGFWNQFLTGLILAPIFMGDSLNSYVLNRVRIETEKGWDDIRITPEGRANSIRWYYLWRGISLLSALFLAGIILTPFSPNVSEFGWVKGGFVAAFLIHFLRCQYSIYAFIAPVVRSYGGVRFIFRVFLLAAVSSAWVSWLCLRNPVHFGKIGILFHGFFYFFLNAFLHPLPSKFSIFNFDEIYGPRVPYKVEPLKPGEAGVSGHPDFAREVAAWKALGNLDELGPFRMPLLEIPIFAVQGEGYLAADRKVLLLLQKNELHERLVRTLISWKGDSVIITTDFGAKDPKLPKNILYNSSSPDVLSEGILKEHLEKINNEAEALTGSPWPKVDELIIQIRGFLKRENSTGKKKERVQSETHLS